jgi:hypothetical protein
MVFHICKCKTTIVFQHKETICPSHPFDVGFPSEEHGVGNGISRRYVLQFLVSKFYTSVRSSSLGNTGEVKSKWLCMRLDC